MEMYVWACIGCVLSFGVMYWALWCEEQRKVMLRLQHKQWVIQCIKMNPHIEVFWDMLDATLKGEFV